MTELKPLVDWLNRIGKKQLDFDSELNSYVIKQTCHDGCLRSIPYSRKIILCLAANNLIGFLLESDPHQYLESFLAMDYPIVMFNVFQYGSIAKLGSSLANHSPEMIQRFYQRLIPSQQTRFDIFKAFIDQDFEALPRDPEFWAQSVKDCNERYNRMNNYMLNFLTCEFPRATLREFILIHELMLRYKQRNQTQSGTNFELITQIADELELREIRNKEYPGYSVLSLFIQTSFETVFWVNSEFDEALEFFTWIDITFYIRIFPLLVMIQKYKGSPTQLRESIRDFFSVPR